MSFNKSEQLPATASTGIAQDHNCGRCSARLAARPTLPQIRALGLFTNSVKLQLAQFFLNLNVFIAAGDRFLHPFGLGKGLLFGSNFDGVRIVALEVDEIGEGG